jgi:hypothetical protein
LFLPAQWGICFFITTNRLMMCSIFPKLHGQVSTYTYKTAL